MMPHWGGKEPTKPRASRSRVSLRLSLLSWMPAQERFKTLLMPREKQRDTYHLCEDKLSLGAVGRNSRILALLSQRKILEL
jgi:hypothetical protein